MQSWGFESAKEARDEAAIAVRIEAEISHRAQ
jgi:hypothetical protein